MTVMPPALHPNARVEVLHGCAIEELDLEPDGSVQMCVTSPPYFGLRSYLPEGHPLKPYEIGTEKTPQEYVAKLVQVFRAVRRVLADDGTLWLNLGDSYSGSGSGKGVWNVPEERKSKVKETYKPSSFGTRTETGLTAKQLIGIPWRVAFALQDDGWYLRQDIIWHKPNPMPESVRDRCTKAHEYIFMLSKKPKYYFDSDAVKEDAVGGTKGAASSFKRRGSKRGIAGVCPNSPTATHREDREDVRYDGETRNRRSVWTVATAPFKGNHFATFPPELIRPCIRAGSRLGDTVLDPFGGSGTTGMVARQEGRNALLCELNADYLPLIQQRTA